MAIALSVSFQNSVTVQSLAHSVKRLPDGQPSSVVGTVLDERPVVKRLPEWEGDIANDAPVPTFRKGWSAALRRRVAPRCREDESMTARKPRGRVGGWRFKCTGCGCEVYQPERDPFDDWICANRRFGKPGSRAVTKSQRPEPAEGWLALSKSQRLEFILAKLGTGDIDLDQYHAMMVEQQLTENDVDDWCREYRACVDLAPIIHRTTSTRQTHHNIRNQPAGNSTMTRDFNKERLRARVSELSERHDSDADFKVEVAKLLVTVVGDERERRSAEQLVKLMTAAKRWFR